MSAVEKLKEKWHEADEAEIDAAIKALLEHRHGRRLLWWMLTIGGVGRQPFARNALDTSFNCGVLNVGQQLLDRIINVSPDGYLTMVKENADERRDRDAELGNAYDRDAGRSDDGANAAGDDYASYD